MQKDEKELHGLLVGEARGFLETQRKIDVKVTALVGLSAVALLLIVVGLAMSRGTASAIKTAVSSLDAATTKVANAAGEITAGTSGPRAEISSLRKRVDRLADKVSQADDSSVKYSGKVSSKSSSKVVASSSSGAKANANKKKGCLGIF